ncbi:lipase family protein [Nocardia cyriacigeorgica]|uniref:lipase family protein n=1 Tax=Nocardia cyriacigeorgica TaxID=135487 RepID=UPI002455C73B|nr:lipase family protein [Nocardia cyriacigeorgica]
MRSIRAVVVAIMIAGMLSTGPATAQPPVPAPPGVPALGIPLPPPPLPDPAAILPGVQQWIDQVVPPPPIPALPPGPVPGQAPATTSPTLAALHQAVLPSPVGDPMFDTWPADLAAQPNGRVLAVRDITATAAPLLTVPIRSAQLVKYRTEDAHGNPSFATATLAVPAAAWTGADARPVVVNNLPIDALGRDCTPGYTLAHGFSSHTALTDFIPPTSQLALLRGYALLIPDHEGPRMAYAEPYVAGHAVLDAIRAVRGLAPGEFGSSRFGITGYSGGAIATHGAVKLIDGYAPELAPVIAGAALGGVPADYEVLARSMNANLASGVFMAAVLAIGRERPEILARMNHLAQWVAISPMKDQCVSVFALPGVLHLPIDIAADMADPLRSPLAADIYQVTRMSGLRAGTPLYIYHGEQEFWLPAEAARALFDEQCALGATAVYRSVFGEHIVAAGLGYPEAMLWLDERLRGVPAVSEC